MTLRMELGPESYDIVLERGCLGRAGELLDLDRRVFVVTDEGVPAAYARTVAAQCKTALVRAVPQGEGSKCFAVLEELLGAMLGAGFGRGDCVCAVGGGVVGDLAGFAAACYMRGVDFYNLPTTVLAQVDSSIGGKTAVNLGGVKNAAGAFWQPKKVLVDPETLSTLDARQRAAGLAEAVKAGLIADAALFGRFEDGSAGEMTEDTVAAALRVKRTIVQADAHERGFRRLLNLGHTVGHGIESVTGLLHGECVGLGMLPMCAPPLRERLRRVLEGLGLPTSVRADPEAVYAALLHDKKMAENGLTVVRADAPGSCRLETVAPETLRKDIEMVVET